MAFIDLDVMFRLPQSRALPSNPLMAATLAMTFQKLGGFFSISSNGKRGIGQPMGCFEDGQTRALIIPQLPDTQPHEQFHSEAEWEGAIKLLGVLLHRIQQSDKDFVFDALATVAVDERAFAPTIADPVRSAGL